MHHDHHAVVAVQRSRRRRRAERSVWHGRRGGREGDECLPERRCMALACTPVAAARAQGEHAGIILTDQRPAPASGAQFCPAG